MGAKLTTRQIVWCATSSLSNHCKELHEWQQWWKSRASLVRQAWGHHAIVTPPRQRILHSRWRFLHQIRPANRTQSVTGKTCPWPYGSWPNQERRMWSIPIGLWDSKARGLTRNCKPVSVLSVQHHRITVHLGSDCKFNMVKEQEKPPPCRPLAAWLCISHSHWHRNLHSLTRCESLAKFSIRSASFSIQKPAFHWELFIYCQEPEQSMQGVEALLMSYHRQAWSGLTTGGIDVRGVLLHTGNLVKQLWTLLRSSFVNW